MRTARPLVTCSRMTDRGPSATFEAISTPRFIGPGCMTMASLLAIARRLVEAHGGRLELGSRPIDGAEFVITLLRRSKET